MITNRSIEDRRILSIENKKYILDFLKRKNTTFLEELSGEKGKLKEIPRRFIFLGYLLFEMNIPISRCYLDLGIGENTARMYKNRLVKAIKDLDAHQKIV